MMKVHEAARILSVSESTIYTLVRQGLLRAHRIGAGRGVIRISDSAISEYLDSSTEPARSTRRRRPGSRLKHIKLSRRPA